MEQSKFIQRSKKRFLRKDILRISEALVGRCSVKKMSLKISPPVYLQVIKIDINPHMHEIFSQRYCMKWLPGNPQKKILN